MDESARHLCAVEVATVNVNTVKSASILGSPANIFPTGLNLGSRGFTIKRGLMQAACHCRLSNNGLSWKTTDNSPSHAGTKEAFAPEKKKRLLSSPMTECPTKNPCLQPAHVCNQQRLLLSGVSKN